MLHLHRYAVTNEAGHAPSAGDETLQFDAGCGSHCIEHMDEIFVADIAARAWRERTAAKAAE
ncbi:hypothetical protein VSR68_39130 [Paraburkholderia phymatum]